MLLLLLFLILLLAHGISTASEDTTISRPPPNVTGPGGKPLPDTRAAKSDRPKEPAFSPSKRLLFKWLSALMIVTFIGNGMNIVIHALTVTWWCGEATAVRILPLQL